ncbi:putative TATA-box-binding protein [Blattamonas nauphoetae]|uniref:TATA-box-binding protein n=1 Tax=Blattamonas nauphoetae TaxID=2049346 RepID=A0ABQ9XKX7_9EUKA|nr:putative TATA-box-binding protein [Blattamonas nauphoetae]
MSKFRIRELIRSARDLALNSQPDFGNQLQLNEVETLVFTKQRQILQIEELCFDVYQKIVTTKPVQDETIIAKIEANRKQLFTMVNPLGQWEQKYSTLLFLVRSYPQLLLKMGREIPHEQLESFIQNHIFPLFKHESSLIERELLIRLINTAIFDEMSVSRDARYFLRANTFASKLLTAYSKTDECVQYLHDVVGPVINAILASSTLDLEMDPLNVARALRLPNSLEVEDAICQKEVSVIILLHKADLQQAVSILLDQINTFTTKIPYGLRQICAAMLQSSPCSTMTVDERHSLVSSIFFLRFVSASIFTPEAYSVLDPKMIDWFRSQPTSTNPFTYLDVCPQFPLPGKLSPPVVAASINNRSRRNLTLIAKIIQTAVNFCSFEEKEKYLKPLSYPFVLDTRHIILHRFCDELCNVDTAYEYVPAEFPLSTYPQYSNPSSPTCPSVPPGIHITIPTANLIMFHRLLTFQQGSFPSKSPAELVLQSLGMKVPEESDFPVNSVQFFVEYSIQEERLRSPTLHPLSLHQLHVRHPIHDFLHAIQHRSFATKASEGTINPIATIPQISALDECLQVIQTAQFEQMELLDWDGQSRKNSGLRAIKFPITPAQMDYLESSLSPLFIYSDQCTCGIKPCADPHLFSIPSTSYSTALPHSYSPSVPITKPSEIHCSLRKKMERIFLRSFPQLQFPFTRTESRRSLTALPKRHRTPTPPPMFHEQPPPFPSPPALPSESNYQLKLPSVQHFSALPLRSTDLKGLFLPKPVLDTSLYIEEPPVPMTESCFTRRPALFSQEWSEAFARKEQISQNGKESLTFSLRMAYELFVKNETSLENVHEAGFIFLTPEEMEQRQLLWNEYEENRKKTFETGKRRQNIRIKQEAKRRQDLIDEEKKEAEKDKKKKKGKIEKPKPKHRFRPIPLGAAIDDDDMTPFEFVNWVSPSEFRRMNIEGGLRKMIEQPIQDDIAIEKKLREQYHDAVKTVQFYEMKASDPTQKEEDDWDILGEEEELEGGLTKRGHIRTPAEILEDAQNLVNDFEVNKKIVCPLNATRGIEITLAKENNELALLEMQFARDISDATSSSFLLGLVMAEYNRIRTQQKQAHQHKFRDDAKRAASVRQRRAQHSFRHPADSRLGYSLEFMTTMQSTFASLPASYQIDTTFRAAPELALINHAPFIASMSRAMASAQSTQRLLQNSVAFHRKNAEHARQTIVSLTSAAVHIRLSIAPVQAQLLKAVQASVVIEKKEANHIQDTLEESMESIAQKASSVGFGSLEEMTDIIGPFMWKMKDMQKMDLLEDRRKATVTSSFTELPYSISPVDAALSDRKSESSRTLARLANAADDDENIFLGSGKKSVVKPKKTGSTESIYSTNYPPCSSPFIAPLSVPTSSFGPGQSPVLSDATNDKAKLIFFRHSGEFVVICFVNPSANDVDHKLVFVTSLSFLISLSLTTETVRIGTITFRTAQFVTFLSKQLFSVRHDESFMLTTPQPQEHEIDLSAHPSGIVPTIQNVIATCFLGTQINLRSVAHNVRNAEYNPRRFPSVVVRLRQPKATLQVFENGKVVCCGAKSEDIAKQSCRRLTKILFKTGVNVTFQKFQIHNMVGNADVKFPIRLEALAAKHVNFSTYEPEMFPGLVYRLANSKITIIMFVSGKIIITGAKSRQDIYTTFEDIYPVLREFSKQSGTAPKM